MFNDSAAVFLLAAGGVLLISGVAAARESQQPAIDDDPWGRVGGTPPGEPTMNPRKISNAGLRLIKNFEGLRLRAYRCPAGVWTIGYGHTGAEVKPGMVITETEAEALLRADIAVFENCVSAAVKVPISQPQFDALVSLAFNIGCGALRRSTLLRRLNAGDYRGAAREFDKWIRAKGVVLAGLVSRRRDERNLFESGIPA